MVNTMARRTDGGVRFRPVGRSRSRTAPVYSPRGTGCPAIEQAVQGLYKGQNEESFWTLMSALNYALELETHVLVPLQTALSAQGAPAPWMEHPIPAEKADGLALWTLRNDKGRCWLPLFTSVTAAGADRSTGSRPMADRTLEQAMQLALDTPGIDGVVLDPWSNSASLDGALLNGLLHAGHTPEDPGAEEAEAGKEAARAGHWAAAAECYQKAAEQGSSAGLSLLGECLYQGRGVPKSAAQARKLWKAAGRPGAYTRYPAPLPRSAAPGGTTTAPCRCRPGSACGWRSTRPATPPAKRRWRRRQKQSRRLPFCSGSTSRTPTAGCRRPSSCSMR